MAAFATLGRMSEESAHSKTSETEVSRQIEQAILEHRLPPGTKLKEVALANFFGVSRGLIRKVLTRLASSKLVEQTPNRGSRVANPSAKEGRDLFAARRAIESAIIDILVTADDPANINKLYELAREEQTAYRALDKAPALELSVDFHRQLAIAAGNQVLQEYLEDIIRRTPLVILAHAGNEQENSCLNQEHFDILDAIVAGDAERAKAIMVAHLKHIESKLQYRSEESTADLTELLTAVERAS